MIFDGTSSKLFFFLSFMNGLLGFSSGLVVVVPHQHQHQKFASTLRLFPRTTAHHRRIDGPSFSTFTTTARFSSITPPSVVESDLEPTNDNEFEDFLDIKHRRLAIQNSYVFDGLEDFQIEQAVHLMERKKSIEPGKKVFTQGDDPDGLYFVASGHFDCFEESSGAVQASLKTGDVFGELGLLLNQPRNLSVKATSPDAAFWRLSTKHFSEIVSGKSRQAAVDAIADQEEYQEFVSVQSRERLLKKCKVFKGLSVNDANGVVRSMKAESFQDGDIVVEEGQAGDTMYFVEEGDFECFRSETGEVMKICSKDSYFGELSMFFKSPRMLSVRAVGSNCKVWTLSREDFLTAVEESPIDDAALELIKKSYEGKTPAAMLDEIYELLVVKSRPLKKPVSFHSTFSVVASGTAIATYLPFFRPGFDENGWPTILNCIDNLPNYSIFELQLSSWMLAIAGALGFFRFPPNIPASRKFSFLYGVTSNLFYAAFITSSANSMGPDTWWFDAFSPLGKTILAVLGLAQAWSNLLTVDDLIAGSDKGREFVSGADTRFIGTITYSITTLLTFLVLASALPVYTSDLAAYQASITDIYYEDGLSSFTIVGFAGALVTSAFISALNTLQFEKKISPLVGSILVFSIMVFFNLDALLLTYKFRAMPESVAPNIELVNGYFAEQFEKSHYFEIVLVVVALTVANGFRKVLAGREVS